MAVLKQKKVLLLFALAIIAGLILSRLPIFVTPKVRSAADLDVRVVDFHSQLDVSLGNQARLQELMNLFADVFFGHDFNRVNIIFTDAEQPKKLFWLSQKKTLINHLGYDFQINGKTLDIYLYNNWQALSDNGWDVARIQQEDELLLLRILYEQRKTPTKQINKAIKETFLIMAKSHSGSIFNLTYAL